MVSIASASSDLCLPSTFAKCLQAKHKLDSAPLTALQTTSEAHCLATSTLLLTSLFPAESTYALVQLAKDVSVSHQCQSISHSLQCCGGRENVNEVEVSPCSCKAASPTGNGTHSSTKRFCFIHIKAPSRKLDTKWIVLRKLLLCCDLSKNQRMMKMMGF